MSTMEDILSTQYQIIDAVEKMYENFKKDGADRKTPQYASKKLETLNSYFKEFELNHRRVREYENQEITYFRDDYYQKFNKMSIEFESRLKQLLVEDKPKVVLKPATPLTTGSFDWSSSPSANGSNVAAAAQQRTPINTNQPQQNIPTVPVRSDRSNTSKLEEMFRKQKSNFKALSRAIESIKLESLSEKWEYEDALQTIQGRWSVVDSLHWEIDSELLSDNTEYEQTYYKYEAKYNEMKKSINSSMWSARHRERSTPTMDIPTFSGNYHQWMSFCDLFTETIHNNKSLSNAQKMQFLKSKVKGEAEKLIQHLHISHDNYQVSWDILFQRYNNKKLILNSHLNILLSLPVMQQQSAAAIKRLHDTTNECLNAIKNLGVDILGWDPIIIYLLSQKLDTDTHNDYVENIQDPKQIPVLEDFLQFLEAKFTALEASRRKQEQSRPSQSTQQQDFIKKPSFGKPNQRIFNKPFINHTNAKSCYISTSKICPVCNNQHGIFYCKTFLELKANEKLKTVAKLNLCQNCLYDHYGKACFSEKRCQHCKGNHNTLLHDGFISNNKSTRVEEPSTSRKNVAHASQDNLAEIILATAQIHVFAADGSKIKLRCLIDQGSQISIITENAAQRLGLSRQRCKGVIFGIGTKENNCKGVINITAQSLSSEYTFSTDVFIMTNMINNLPNRSFQKPNWSHLEGIQLADPDFNISRSVDILLGADIYSKIILGGIIREDESLPIIQQSRLGWIICGNMKSYQCNVVINNIEDISRFWAIEDMPDSSVNMSTEDHLCLEQYKMETTRNLDGRYVVRLPLKPEIKEKLGESKQKAIAQFYQLEKKFQKHKEIAKEYINFMNEYQELGHMVPCASNVTPTYHLPHHCVQRAESTTTALRVVFNASSKTSSGYSLNDLMYRGPNLQADLLSLILRWRQYKIAFTADIEKMFRQILCHEDDQIYQKIIWRERNDQLLKEYALTTVTYGTKAAPFLAMMTLKQLAADENQKYPEASKVLEHDFYMDDLISGAHSIQSAKQIKSDLIDLLKSGGFNLRKWASNNHEISEKSKSNEQKSFDFKYQESTKALGLRWNPHEDVFTFQLKINTSISDPATKRTLLSDISKIFDPLGWLCPLKTKLKLLFQTVWQQDIQWDETISEALNNEWIKIKQDLGEINNLQIPRWLASQENDDIELHGFCDASESAYACVIYSKIKTQGEPKITIIAAKSRLVPQKKSVSLPRLELCAAVLLSDLMKTVQQNLSNHNIKIYGWSDSTAVLGWIQGDTNRWKPFVSNRVQKIKQIISAECWHYIKSADNPADCASRGITALQLKEHKLWWNGPPSILSNQEQKNQEIIIYDTNQEVKKSLQSNVVTQRHDSDVIRDLINRHSCLTRVTRVLAWLLRVVSSSKRREPYLTALEINEAKKKLIKNIQLECFSDEINALQQNKNLRSKSKILPLNPFLDQQGLLRVGGRIRNAHIDDNMKHPLIIPHDHHFTDLLIDNAHQTTFHGGARLTLSHLRQEVWIIGGIRAVKKRLHNCVTCRKHNPLKQNQIMGDLPTARCNLTRPFHHTGVDFTGYIDVKANKGRGIKTTKSYVAVFVCMVTKAVHLELVSDLSSSAFLAALRRFAARRGSPRHIYSDNGTNFTAASKRLNQEFIDLKSTLDTEFFSTISKMRIEWHFNAPSWPSAGGLWEAAVKSLKHHLRRVIGEQKLTYEELSTLLAQIEGCLNARPLCALREDPDDIDCLTPSHFLSSGPTLTIIETEKDERTRWQLVQKIFKDIWKRWQSEYLCQLSSRSKWQQAQTNIKVDDIVIIHDANLPAGKWALGRVIDLHPGKDGYVRVVSVKTKNGVIKRPIIKLSRLPVNQSSEKEEMSKQENNSTQKDKPAKTNSKESKPKESRKCNFLTLTALMIISIISPAKCEYRLSSINENQSIFFDQISNMQLVRDEWKLIVYYDLDPYWQGLVLLVKYINNLENICSKTSKQTHCDVVLLQLHHAFRELEYYNNLMLGQQGARAATRYRRGLINGVGYLANSLFGVLDEHFAEQYQRDINLIRDNQKHLALLWKNQTSVVEAEYNLLKRVEQAMDKQHKIFHQQILALEKNTNNLSKKVEEVEIINEFALLSIIANNILVNLKSIQETLLDTITDIHYGKFNIHLLTPEQLQDELNIISGQISKDLSIPINNIQTDLSSIYHLLKVKARTTKQYFIFEIKIPLISRDNFEIYKLIPIPHQQQENMVVISPIAEYLAINIRKDSYIVLSENEVQNCLQYDPHTQLCPLQRPIHHMTSDSNLCIKDQISDQCKTNIMSCKDTWTDLIQLNTYFYFSCGQHTIRIMCGDQATTEKLSKAGLMTLGDGCVIKGEGFEIFAHKRLTNNLNAHPDLIHIEIPPINNIINLTMPSGIMETANDSDKIDYQRDLQSIDAQIKQMKSDEANGVLADHLSYHDMHQFVVLYLLVGAGLFAIVLIVWRRWRLRCSTRLQSAPPSERSIPAVHFSRTNETNHSTNQHHRSDSVDNVVNISAGASNSSARVLNKANSPILINRFIEREV